MANKPRTLLLSVLNEPEICREFSERDWDLLLCQARAGQLVAKLAGLLLPMRAAFGIPGRVARHLESEWTVAEAVKRGALWEALCIHEALAPLGVKVILLKGAAYALADAAAGRGRLFQDIDILAPKSRLADVERMLMWHGWLDAKTDPYDQKYYRQWMHELPPKFHRQRGVTLDVHHNILPETCALCPDGARLIEAAVPIVGSDYWQLAPVDQLLHSAAHLFWDGEFDKGLRDLTDIDALWRDFARQPEFGQNLADRARHLRLERPLFYALRYAGKLLATPISEALRNAAAPNRITLAVMDFLFLRALQPDHPDSADRWTGLARWLLYLRGHWLRMPLALLFPHLLRKSWRNLNRPESKNV